LLFYQATTVKNIAQKPIVYCAIVFKPARSIREVQSDYFHSSSCS